MGDRLLSTSIRPELWAGMLGLAVFLVVCWFLRGAPLGQRAEEETEPGIPGPRARDWAVIVTALGLLAILAGGFVALAYHIAWSLPCFMAGFALLWRQAQVHRPHRHASPTLHRVVRFAEGAMTASLLGGIVVVGNLLAFRYGGRPFDLTREGTFSLSSLTVKQLQTLEKPVTFTVVASDQRTPRVLQLLALYRAENPRFVRVERMDPYADPAGFQELARQSPDLALNSQGGAIVVEYGQGETSQRVVVRAADLFEVPEPDPAATRADRIESRFKGEDTLTSALIRLREGTTITIAVTTGHGESQILPTDGNQPGIGLLAARLRALGIDLIELPPGRWPVDQTFDLVLIAGPQSAFAPEEVDRLRDYMSRGGKALVLLDNRQATGLDDWLKSYNVALGPGQMLDPQLNYEGRASLLAAPIPTGGRHPIVEALSNRYILLARAAPLRILSGPAPDGPAVPLANPAVDVAVVLRTGVASWAETEPDKPPVRRDPKEEPGPLTIALAVTDRQSTAPGTSGPAPPPRLVVVSSRFVADNFFVARNAPNLDFVVNAVNWLRGRPDLQGITPKTHVALTLSADPGLRAKLIMIPTLIATTVILALGITTFLARRT